ncbi:MAG TPA: CHASE domain-containing protein, partial [Gammaproteobacteria bacterium]
MDKNHSLITGLILVLGISLSLFISWKFYGMETEAITADFKKAVDEDVSLIDREIKLNFEAVYILKTLFDSSYAVTTEEFHSAAQSILARHNKIFALAWAPKITAQERTAYESKKRREVPAFRITQFNDGTLQSAPKREVYFPISYLEPLTTNEAALGFDVASDPVRLEALTASTDSGEMHITRSIT